VPGQELEEPVRIQILGRAGCHLCDVARDIVEIVAAETGTGFVEVDIDGDPELKARYSDYVPVLLVDGVEHSHWRVDAARLRAALG
jgi:hypothetical protein